MKDNFRNIHKVISSYIDISDKEWACYASKFRIQEFEKKSIILNEGNICRDVFFVNKGLLRVYFIDNNGEEKTFHFALKNTFIADYESFFKRNPSNYSIQAMEDTSIVLVSRDVLEHGYKVLRNGERLGRLLAEDYLFICNDKLLAIYTQTPLQRYHNLASEFSNIFQRIPQHYIASYLNISSVHLSRLKSNTNKNT